MTRQDILTKLDNVRNDIKLPTYNLGNDKQAPINVDRLKNWVNEIDDVIIAISRGDIK